MKFTVMKDKAHGYTQEVEKFEDLAKYMLTHDISCGVFKNGHKTKSNFIQAETIGLDFDNGMTIQAAKELFKNYSHIIATTKSHTEDNHRFRVILQLDKVVTKAEDITATWFELKKLAPAIDDATKDASRYWAKHKELLNIDPNKKKWPVSKFVPKTEEPKVEVPIGERGALAKSTMELLIFGAPKGLRHRALQKAAIDAHEQGYSKQEFRALLNNMIKSGGDWETDYINAHDDKTIDDMYAQTPKHAPRLKEKAFDFKPIGEMMKNPKKMTWVVDNLLTEGGVSMLAGKPKSGKSTLVRQLALCVVRGEQFLERKVKKGSVLYLALEEQEEMLYTQFKTLGITKKDDILIHVGGVRSVDFWEELEEYLLINSPSLFVVDTFLLLAQVKDSNNYNEINDALARFRKLARATKTHIVMIHHTNKSGQGTDSIMGSVAIHGGIDNAMIFVERGGERFITSSQRGGKGFNDQQLVFHKEKEVYTLGENNGDW